MKRALLVGHLSDANLGDAAILAGTVALVREARPELELAVLPGMPPNALSAADTATCRSEGVAVLEPLCPPPVRGVSPERGLSFYLGTAAALTRTALVLLLARLSPSLARRLVPRRARASFDALRAAAIVIVNGGSSLRCESRASHVVHVWRYLFPVLLGIALGRRVVALGHSIGPIEPGLPAMLLRFGLRRDWEIYARDATSQALLRELTGRDLPWIPDCALALGVDYGSRRNGRKVAVSIRSVRGEDAIAESLVGVLGELDEPPIVALVPNAFGPSPTQDDRPLVGRLAARLRERGYRVEEADYHDARAVRDFYGTCHAVVGVRMHASILARLAGTPSLPLEYEGHKAGGVFAYLAPGVDVPSVHDDFGPELAARLGVYLADGLPASERLATESSVALLRSMVAEILRSER